MAKTSNMSVKNFMSPGIDNKFQKNNVYKTMDKVLGARFNMETQGAKFANTLGTPPSVPFSS